MNITKISPVTYLENELDIPVTRDEYADLLFNSSSDVWQRLTPEEIDFVELGIFPEDHIDRFKE